MLHPSPAQRQTQMISYPSFIERILTCPYSVHPRFSGILTDSFTNDQNNNPATDMQDDALAFLNLDGMDEDEASHGAPITALCCLI